MFVFFLGSFHVVPWIGYWAGILFYVAIAIGLWRMYNNKLFLNTPLGRYLVIADVRFGIDHILSPGDPTDYKGMVRHSEQWKQAIQRQATEAVAKNHYGRVLRDGATYKWELFPQYPMMTYKAFLTNYDTQECKAKMYICTERGQPLWLERNAESGYQYRIQENQIAISFHRFMTEVNKERNMAVSLHTFGTEDIALQLCKSFPIQCVMVTYDLQQNPYYTPYTKLGCGRLQYEDTTWNQSEFVWYKLMHPTTICIVREDSGSKQFTRIFSWFCIVQAIVFDDIDCWKFESSWKVRLPTCVQVNSIMAMEDDLYFIDRFHPSSFLLQVRLFFFVKKKGGGESERCGNVF